MDIDYLEEARHNTRVTPTTTDEFLQKAQAFALIAIAEELRRANEAAAAKTIGEAVLAELGGYL